MTIVVAGGASGGGNQTMATLTAAVARWLNRTDLGPVLAGFVGMAEAEIARDTRLRVSGQTLWLYGSTQTGDVLAPTDMLELLEFKLGDVVLRELPYDDWQRVDGEGYFARVGEMLRCHGSGPYTLTYLQQFQALRSDADSNWLLREHFDVYLYKCCEVGSVYLRDPEGAKGYAGKYEAAAAALMRAENRRRWSGAQLQVLAPGVV